MAIEIPGPPPIRATADGDSWAHYLDPDERLLWEGAPSGGVRFRASDLAVSLFGAAFLLFALFWTGMATMMTAFAGIGQGMGMASGIGPETVLFPAFGLPFIAVGLYLVFGRLLWSAYDRRHTRYALTDRRAMVARSAWGRSLKSYPIDEDTLIDYRPGNEATIWFAKEERRGSKGRRYTVKHGFEFIPDGDEVYRLLRQVQRQAAERRGE